jgi:hypothetical protein
MKLYVIITAIVFCNMAICQDMESDHGHGSHSTQRPSSRAERLKEREEQARQVFTKSQSNLNHILEAVGANKEIGEDKLEEISRDYIAARQNFRYLADHEQSQMMLLDGWLTYLQQGSAEEALKRAEKSCMLNPVNGDAFASSIVFSLLSGREPKSEEMILRLARGGRDAQKPVMGGSMLHVDVPEFARMMISRKVPVAVPAATGDEESYICTLLWTLKPEPVSTADFEKLKAVKDQLSPDKRALIDQLTDKPEVSEDYVKEQVENFGLLYEHNTAQDKINFLSINVDESIVLKDFMEKHSPEPAPISAANLGMIDDQVKHAIQMTGAMMLIIDKDSTVRYAGGSKGFLPIMMLNELVPGSQKERQIETDKNASHGQMMHDMGMPPDDLRDTSRRGEPSDSNSLPAEQSGHEQGGDEDQLTEEQRQENDAKLKPEQRAEAEKLLTGARMFRGSHTRLGSSRRVAENCFEVIEKFPGTTYEAQALEILESVPAHQKKRYGIEE